MSKQDSRIRNEVKNQGIAPNSRLRVNHNISDATQNSVHIQVSIVDKLGHSSAVFQKRVDLVQSIADAIYNGLSGKYRVSMGVSISTDGTRNWILVGDKTNTIVRYKVDEKNPDEKVEISIIGAEGKKNSSFYNIVIKAVAKVMA